MAQVFGVVKFDQGCVINGLIALLQQQAVYMHGNISVVLDSHQCRDRVGGMVESRCADVESFLENRPATGFEYRADRFAGKNLRVLGIDQRIRLINEPHHRIRAAGAVAILITVKVRVPKSRLVADDIDAVAAKAIGNPFAVEPLGFMCAGVQSCRDDRSGYIVAVHNTYCQPLDGAPYTLAIAG